MLRIFLLKIATIKAIIEDSILGLFSKSKFPSLSRKIPGNIIAGKTADGTKVNNCFIFGLILLTSKKDKGKNFKKKFKIPEITIPNQIIFQLPFFF